MIDLPMFKLINRFAKRLDHNWYIIDDGVSYTNMYHLVCDEVGTISFKLRYELTARDGELALDYYYEPAEVIERNPNYKLPMVIDNVCKNLNKILKGEGR